MAFLARAVRFCSVMWLGSTRLPLWEVLVAERDLRPEAEAAPVRCEPEVVRAMVVSLTERLWDSKR